ncbi:MULTISPECIES: TetR/AcrR family transcriptional regulator [unclassified Pseudonocardia]|uniref:TetR/AcrR family transcriptional regulator n=1 Tax=unclassified Pseudonocardia TaxID=2619320 RepID=UPI0001FFDFDC|nr:MULTISPECIES: TetR/AcrR family transcriptional regulator [unclassified Pseudonocardia]ALE72721.1 transcriptional regulator, TetR family protein [Pseudonocardia sp. EC080625-04]ALL76035.1 transcriptional regulator, TetR family protein [Pseudonocardia sp. EC080610-09]ALL83063.1 transcriptional regulator, TetR family protein [Pseudonocardia sp. EC080619-01]OLM19776.1 Transcriptional regulator, TetR family [Pseudonocardia sp. Ae707_Ps1]
MDDEEVPATLRRLWGRAGRPRRGPKPALSTDRIVRTAADLADAEGLGAVSMARVADVLGCTAMALYRHVESKDELLALLADHIAEPLTMPEHAGDWRSGLEAWTRAQIDAALARPWFLELPLAAARIGPNRVRWMEEAFAVLAEVDLRGDEKLAVVGLLAQHVLAEARVQLETTLAAADDVRRRRGLPADTPLSELDPAEVTAANPMHDFETVLHDLAAPGDYPHLKAALADMPAPVLTGARDPDAEIDLGLGLVLDGVEAYVRARSAGPPPRPPGDGTVGGPRHHGSRDDRIGDRPAG